jgi:hypothetical protein
MKTCAVYGGADSRIARVVEQARISSLVRGTASREPRQGSRAVPYLRSMSLE